MLVICSSRAVTSELECQCHGQLRYGAWSLITRIEDQIVGAKTWMLVYANRNVGDALRGGPQLDRDATLHSILAAKEFGIDYPSKLPAPFISVGGGGTVYLHAMHSVLDWFAYAHWINGQLVRSLSLSPDSGILEDIGQQLPFEEPFWSGKNPASDDEEDAYIFPFHPLELGEAALKEFFGYQLEGFIDPALLQPESIPLVKYKRSRSRWKFW